MESQISLLLNAREDSAWIDSNFDSLMRQYKGKFIAVKSKKVIASSKEMEDIVKKVGEAGYDSAKVLIRFISNKIAIL